ncbi:MAG: hypothetical protein CL462_12580 [Acidimicrobiaceae bacterium]|nr:hypothetical protein [Acidimicrobiaceae bacterium]
MRLRTAHTQKQDQVVNGSDNEFKLADLSALSLRYGPPESRGVPAGEDLPPAQAPDAEFRRP